jgi:hypothetical protein
VEAEEEIAAIVVVVGVKVDEVVEEEGGARLRPRGNEDGRMEERGEPLCFHETIIKQTIPRFCDIFWRTGLA